MFNAIDQIKTRGNNFIIPGNLYFWNYDANIFDPFMMGDHCTKDVWITSEKETRIKIGGLTQKHPFLLLKIFQTGEFNFEMEILLLQKDIIGYIFICLDNWDQITTFSQEEKTCKN